MTLTPSMSKVLSAIADDHNYGYKIAQVLHMSHGSIYAVLRRLSDAGYVTVSDGFTDAGLPCRWYEVHPAHAERVIAGVDAVSSKGSSTRS